MLWRRTRAEFERKKGEGNTRAMRAVVTSGEVPGILAFLGDIPIAGALGSATRPIMRCEIKSGTRKMTSVGR
ncbi:MAG: hypothetical protein HY207_13245 [Nitrospirae bacterium]|nr:hypothetical protein [Nitrospirota bacterium]